MSMVISGTYEVSQRLRAVDPATATRVVHFDQLDHDQQNAFLELYRGEQAMDCLPTDTVIVFTDYFRIESR